MSTISHRACHMLGLNDENLNRFVEEIKSYMTEIDVPETYSVNVYKDQITCCGHIPIGIVVEIEGSKVQPIRNLDEKILGKITEICGRENIKNHECSPLEILQEINGEIFSQD